MLNAIGFIGGLCFTLCGVPAAWFSWYDGEANTPRHVCIPIFLGACLMYFYLCKRMGFDWPITFTYVTEIISWGIVTYYSFRPRKHYVSPTLPPS